MKTKKGHDLEAVTEIHARCTVPGCTCKIRVRVVGLRGELGKRLAIELKRADAHPECRPCEVIRAENKASKVTDSAKEPKNGHELSPAEVDRLYAETARAAP